jgi:hypothetical protein
MEQESNINRTRGGSSANSNRYQGGEAEVIRRHGNLLTLKNGEEYYYVNETSVQERGQASAKQMKSRMMRDIEIALDDQQDRSYTISTNLNENDLDLGKAVNWRRNQQSSCPVDYWIDKQKKESSATTEKPSLMDFNVDLSTGTHLCSNNNSPSSSQQTKSLTETGGRESETNQMEVEPTKKSTRLRVCSWNVNHLSNDGERKETKINGIIYLLRKTKPDVLVMHEINLYNEAHNGKVWTVDDVDYTWRMGPMLRASGNFNVTKQGSQYEYYALLHSPRVKITDEYTIVVHESCDEDVRQYTRETVGSGKKAMVAETARWVEHRPLVVRELVLDGGAKFALGIVHTSPSFKVEKSAFEYVRAMDARYTRADPKKSVPWMLAGDWYVKTSYKVSSGDIQQNWSEVLVDWNARLWNTTEDTNFPGNGRGMPADYFVTDSEWTLQGAAQVVPLALPEHTGQIIQINLGRATISESTGFFDAAPAQFASLTECGALQEGEGNHGTLKVGDTVFFHRDGQQRAYNLTKFIGRRWEQEGFSDHAPVFGEFDFYYEP